MTKKAKPTGQLSPLTSFRFFAAMAIVCFHSIGGAHDYLRSGVTFFYVLSGFVLAYVHPSLSGSVEFLRFWVSRIARIWPKVSVKGHAEEVLAAAKAL